MSSGKPTDDNKNEEKPEPQYLTLADKNPSLIRETGNESTSARTISTRELSVNLQKTRDGMINLIRKKKGYDDGLGSIHGSDSGDGNNEDFLGLGMPVRGKQTRKGDDMNGSSVNDTTKGGKKRFGMNGEFGSEDGDTNRQSGLSNDTYGSGGQNMGKSQGKNGQRGRRGGSDDSDEDNDQSGKNRKYGKNGKYVQGFDKENDQFGNKRNKKLLKSQNEKKDGPLITRIFIDAFLPSLEGNRISPLFNWRCAEKVERLNPDFYDRNRKGKNKQLAAVSSTEKCVVDESSSGSCEDITTGRTIRKKGEHGSIEEVLVVDEYGNEQRIKKEEKLQQVIDMQGNQELKKVEKKTTNEVNRKDNVRKQRGEQQGVEHKKDVEDVSSRENSRPQTPNTTTKTGHNDVAASPDKQTKSNVDKTKDEATEKSSPNNQTKSKVDDRKNEATTKDGTAIEVDDDLLKRVLRTLLDNEELVDFFCEKVISKIAARNNFCGPNCGGVCAGLNKTSA